MASEAKPGYWSVTESELLAAREVANACFNLYGTVDFLFDRHTLQEKSPISDNSAIVLLPGAEWRDGNGPQSYDWPAKLSAKEWALCCSWYDELHEGAEASLNSDALHIIELGTYGLHNPEGIKLFGQKHPTVHHAALAALWEVGSIVDECRRIGLEVTDPKWRAWIRERAKSFEPLMPFIDSSYVAISQEWRAAVLYLKSQRAARTDDSSLSSDRRPPTANARILDTLQKVPESLGWSAEQFAEHLGLRSKGTVANTPAWKSLMKTREMEKRARMERRPEA